ncbi:ABC transporter substrate-binding protein [Brachybacterium saurashtrense]|uniref:Extracellular solute-binding protein n=1 Tax=Brachybacterium saurashtrense TaxID=556288 RepID=A0A345YL46_9MICO|nr:extracellular solute-binding protein [Brachybacterium saurashtrense]AXK44648.1 extracellular solute-binding protein [Brachybacterium saurashtrense]RRR23260.1 extracellular solute-binding protein [Brachybacterium saurashtrense]
MATTRRSFLAAGSGAAAVSLAGCGLSGNGGSGGDEAAEEAASGEVTGEITFQSWSLKNETFTPFFEKVIADFEEQNPGTTVQWMDQPGEGYQDKVLAQANSDALPDVINLPPDLAYPLASTDFLLDLGAAVPELSSTYVEGAVQGYQFPQVEGSFGFPWYLGTDMNWWNLGELSAYGVDESSLPTSMEEMFELARTAHEEGAENPVVSNMPEIVITSNDAGEFDFNTAENVALLQQYVDLYADGAMPPEVLNDDYTGNATLYKQGKVLWTTATSSFAGDLEKEAPSLLENTVVAPRFGNPPLFVQGICVSKMSANSATALAFAQFLTNDENQIAFCTLAQGFLPGTQKAAADPSKFAETSDLELANRAVEVASESMQNAVDTTNVLWTEDMRTNLVQQMAKAMQGDLSAQEALDSAVEYGNQNLA